MKRDAWVILLRGVNVGGSNKLPMKSLAALAEECGAQEVRTYIQSGNVVFTAAKRVVSTIPEKLEAAIYAEHGFAPAVVVRSAAVLQQVLEENPWSREGADEDRQIVYLLRDTPTPEALLRLETDRWLPDRFSVRGGEIYACYSHGMCKSKMTNAYFDSRLNTISTGRNLRTLRRLLAMCAE